MHPQNPFKPLTVTQASTMIGETVILLTIPAGEDGLYSRDIQMTPVKIQQVFPAGRRGRRVAHYATIQIEGGEPLRVCGNDSIESEIEDVCWQYLFLSAEFAAASVLEERKNFEATTEALMDTVKNDPFIGSAFGSPSKPVEPAVTPIAAPLPTPATVVTLRARSLRSI